jgi:hypothetical protein
VRVVVAEIETMGDACNASCWNCWVETRHEKPERVTGLVEVEVEVGGGAEAK